MKVALVGAELEENLGLRYIASALEHRGHKEREKNKTPFSLCTLQHKLKGRKYHLS
jgi:hypothetical protein